MTKPFSQPRQISLDIGQDPKMTLENFIGGSNQSLLKSLEVVVHPIGILKPEDRLIHLWGVQGCGKTHLLTALNAKSLLTPQSTVDEWHSIITHLEASQTLLICVDDVDLLDESAQAALFRIHNLVRESEGSRLITSASLPPASLAVRDDLRTRLAWGLVFQMHALSDEEKLQAIDQTAVERGMNLSPEVGPWLIKHFHRDMPSLMAVMEALDLYSLETKRAVTLPLLKEMLAQKN